MKKMRMIFSFRSKHFLCDLVILLTIIKRYRTVNKIRCSTIFFTVKKGTVKIPFVLIINQRRDIDCL